MFQRSQHGSRERERLVLSFPSSNQNVRADLRALEQASMLSAFCTTIAWRRSQSLFSVLPSGFRQELTRRVFEGVDPRRVFTFPTREFARLIADRLGATALTRHETGMFCVDRVSEGFDRGVARLIRRRKLRAAAVYAYEYAARASFEAAGEMGMRRFYELSTGYWRAGLRILGEERERSPEWTQTLDLLYDSGRKGEHKDAEIRSANYIVVPSAFVRETLRQHPGMSATIDVIAYGAPNVPTNIPSRPRSDKLRLLYVGNLTQLKGLSYLFAAMKSLRSAATLTLIGAKPLTECEALAAALKEHEWLGSVPHQRVLEIMGRHDVLVFPTLFDGFGLVILEAMSRGLPVITTPNAGGSTVIEHGEDGFVVPIRDAEAIAVRVLELHGDRQKLAAMSEAALDKARRMSWETRARMFIQALRRRMDLPDPQIHQVNGVNTW